LKGKKVGVSSIGSGPDSLLRILSRSTTSTAAATSRLLATGAGPQRFFALKVGATDAAVLNEQAALMAQESGLRELFAFTKGEEFVEVQGQHRAAGFADRVRARLRAEVRARDAERPSLSPRQPRRHRRDPLARA
jgi:hypothetical protein